MNLLLVRTGGVGDCILTLPVGSRLRELHPNADLHILGNGTMRDVARLAGGYAGLHSIDAAWFASLFSGAEQTDFLRSFFSRYDGVWFFTAADPAAMRRTVLASGAHACRVLDPRPPKGFRGHTATHLLSIIGESPSEPPTSFPISLEYAPARIPNRLLIHAGSGGARKTWPLNYFLEIAERWEGEAVFLIGPAEEERGIGDLIPGRWETLRGLTIEGTARALVSSKLFLGCDSGVSHLAGLCRTPSVVLFGPTDPAVWRPLGERTTVIASPDSTMEGIGVERVIETVERLQSGLD